jgi:hypothetical protein
MKIAKKIMVVMLILWGNVNLHPSTGHDVEVKCPLCDSTVTYWKQFSYSIFTYGLDLKPIGAARIPQPIPKCKNCGFAFIEDYFTDDEIQILKNHIINQKVFAQKENFPIYYYLAFASELLDSKDYEDMVYFYVCSVWEYSFNKLAVEHNVEGIAFDRNIFISLMHTAIEKINGLKNYSEEYDNMQLIKLDFLRRLGLFDEAKKLIADIKKNESLYQEIVIDIIAYQTELIEKKDIDEHYVEELEAETY